MDTVSNFALHKISIKELMAMIIIDTQITDIILKTAVVGETYNILI